MERSEAGTGEQAPASEGLHGRGARIDETAAERPAQHGPGPPVSSTVCEPESSPATVHRQASQEAPVSADAPAEQQIGQLQAELAAVKQSLATYESTLQQLLGAQLLPSALRQLQLQHQSSGHVLQGARSEGQVDTIASGGARALLAQAPAGQQQQMQRDTELQSGSMGVLHTNIGSLGSSVDPGSEGLSLQSPDPLKVAHKQEQTIALRSTMTTPEGAPVVRLQYRQRHEQTLSEAAAGTHTPPAPSGAGSFFDTAADAAINSAGASTAGARLLQSSASAPAMGESSLAAATAAAPFGPSPSGPSSSALRLSSSVGAADAIATPSPGGGASCDFQTGSSMPGLPPGFPISPEGLLVSPSGSGAAGGIHSSPGLNLSPVALAGGMGPPPQQQSQLTTAAGTFPPPLPAVRQSLRQPASLTSPPSGSGGLTPELAGSSSGGYAWLETAGQGLSGYQQLGQQQLQQQQRQIVSPSLSHHGLVPDTAGSLSSSLSPSGLAAAAAAAAAAASTAGSFSLMSAVVGASPAGATASAFEQDVIPSGSGGDQLMSAQLQALHSSEDVAAAAAAAEQYALAQQLQQQHQTVEAAGYGGAAQAAQAEQLLAAMQQYGIQDPAVAAAMIAAAAAGQPGVSPGYGWDPAAAAAVSAGLDQGATASYQAQQAAQALASLNLQVQAAAQAEQLQAYQQAQLMQQLQQQYSNPYTQQLLMAQAAAAAAAATALRQQQWQQGGGRGKLAPAHPGSGSSSGSSRRSSKGTDVYASGTRDARKSSGSKAAGAAGSGAAGRPGRGPDEAPDWRRVFVGNIGWWVDEEMLKNVFGEYGSILDAQVMWNTKLLAKGKRVNREFAFISYSTPEEAGVAIRHMHGRYIEGITKDRDGLTVQFEAQGMSKPPTHNHHHHQQQQQLPPALQHLTSAAALQQQSAAAVQQQQLLLQQLQQQQQQQQGALQLLHQQQQQQQGQFVLLQQLQDYQQQQQPDSAAFLGLGSPGLYGSQGSGRPAQGASVPPHTPGGPAV